jgi:hypothetical protein
MLMKIKARHDLTIYGQDIKGDGENTTVLEGDEFVVEGYAEFDSESFEVTINGDWAILLKFDWDVIEDGSITYEELRKEYHKIDEYWKWQNKGVLIKVLWTLWENNYDGEDVPAIATNGQKYVYTNDDLETTVDCLENYTVYEFKED